MAWTDVMFVILLFLALSTDAESSCEETNDCSDPNASRHDCPRYCQPTCAQPNTTDVICIQECLPSGCVCNPGYILNQTGGICIRVEDCPPAGCRGDPNAISVNVPTYCQPTCNRPYKNGEICDIGPDTQGCVCKAGFVLEEFSGLCVYPPQCTDYPHKCPNDSNALVTRNPNPCPPTCANPNTRAESCNKTCLQKGCECSSGYILAEQGGKCIAPKNCPGGSPNCGENKTFVDCYVDCSSRYCPVNDNSCRDEICQITYPCLSGCACQKGYLMFSREDPRCVLPSNCPPMECTRPNEVFEPYTACVEQCSDRDPDCVGNCPGEGRCVCKSGYFRDTNGVCVYVFFIF